YDGGVTVSNAELRGACAAGVTVTTAMPASAIEANAPAAQTSGMRIVGTDAAGIGLRVRSGTLSGRNLILQGQNAGLRLEANASFSGERVRVVGASAPRVGTDAGFALAMLAGSTAILRSSTIIGGEVAAIGGPS